MKRMFLLLLTLAIAFALRAEVTDITIKYNDGAAPEILAAVEMNGVPYFNVYELNKVFNARIREDETDQRLRVDLYGAQLIFLINSAWFQATDKNYRMLYPLRSENMRYYLPLSFIEQNLAGVLGGKIAYDASKKIVTAEAPVDHSIKRIILDPGHGGVDPGAIGFSKDNHEKNIVLDIAKKLKKRLEYELDIEVLMTRDTDEFISLRNRSKFANENQGDLFISIHCNASPNRKTTGIEVFFLSPAKTNDARAVEALENSVVQKYEGGEDAVRRYDDLSFILMDMAQTEQLQESCDLAWKLQANLVSASRSVDRGVKQAGFYVLRVSFMPAVLVELGFISNKDEEKKLLSSSYQDKLVAALYEGIKDFKFKYDRVR